MAKTKSVSPRKEPVQSRSLELRRAILEAATYVLKQEGPAGFTTNKVADRAGVSIASVYQYYPNKESLLFHLVELEWSNTFNKVFPILQNETLSHRSRFKEFVHAFYETEVGEYNLKVAMANAGLLIEHSDEYRAIFLKGQAVLEEFLMSAQKSPRSEELSQRAEFIQSTITSYSECKRGKVWSNKAGDTEIMSEMICSHFGIED